jgi:ubiquitin-like-conjugating enzyme ATG10
MSWSIERFNQEVERFLQHSNHICDLWIIKEHSISNTILKYLEKRHVWISGFDVAASHPSPPMKTGWTTSSLLKFDYWILYSISYQVPVLYFMVYNEDHQPLTHEQILTYIIPHQFRREFIQLGILGISLTTHPIIQTLCWFLHPCGTAELINQVLQTSHTNCSWIASWLSLIGGVIRLYLDDSYASCSLCHLGN